MSAIRGNDEGRRSDATSTCVCALASWSNCHVPLNSGSVSRRRAELFKHVVHIGKNHLIRELAV